MEWVKLAVSINEEASEMISEILLEAGAAGTETAGGAMPDLTGYDEVPPDEIPSGECTVSAYFPLDAEVKAKIAEVEKKLRNLKDIDLGFDPGTLEIKTATVNEQDWENEWKKYFKPQRVSDFVVIKPTWEEYSPEKDDVIIEIDPGMAFGTGTHETTRMCIAMLEEYLEDGASVLDVGCGSGILSVAAAKLGAGSVLALDLDGVAVEVAGQNVRLNNVEDRVSVIRSDIVTAVPEGSKFDIVVANIIADIIIRLNESVLKYIKRPGIYICSGIIAERLDEVLASLNKNGLRAIKVSKMGEWRAVACMNKG
jgi:ribosomal protein L11 methyltransferase